MPALVSAMVASIGLILAAPVFYIITCTAGHRIFILGHKESLLLAAVVTFALFVPAWLRTWGTLVRWSYRRAYFTLIVFFASISIGLGAGVLYCQVDSTGRGFRRPDESILIGAMAGLAAWVFGTALAWRETPDERHLRLQAAGVGTLPCPHCGYDLTGLHEARCPECGTQYTLNELVAGVLERRTGIPG